MNCQVCCLMGIGVLLGSAAPSVTAASVDAESIRRALQGSVQYLQRDGRAWFEGEIAVQHQACVSCHQVPTGSWGLSAAYSALGEEPPSEFEAMFEDATQFAANAEVGRAAMWSQFLIAAQVSRETPPVDLDQLIDTYRPLILHDQQENGSWPAKGQFPYQRRPIVESDAVVTMWMIHALQVSHLNSPPIVKSIQRGRHFVESVTGTSTEWLAWRLIISESSEPERTEYRRQLLAGQTPDGSWAWTEGDAGNAYATGVALYALAATSDELHGALDKAASYLLKNQSDDGSWSVDSLLISKEGGAGNDYVYRYWSTAWATIGLSELLKDGKSDPPRLRVLDTAR